MPVSIVTEGDIIGLVGDSKDKIIYDEQSLADDLARRDFRGNVSGLINNTYALLPLSLLRASFSDAEKKDECMRQLTNNGEFLAERARANYDVLKEIVLAKKLQPTFELTKLNREQIRAGVDFCPPWVAQCFLKSDVKIVILKNNSDSIDFHSAAEAHRDVILVRASSLKDPSTIREEILHEIDMNLTRYDSKSSAFTDHPEFVSAITRDMKKVKEKALYPFLLKEYDSFDKTNKTLFSSITDMPDPSDIAVEEEGLSLDDVNERTSLYREVLPDMYDLASIVDSILAKDGYIQLSAKSKRYTTKEQVMRSLFPETWPLINGPAEGNKLVHYYDGRIEEVDKESPLPKGAKAVLSFKEECELWLKDHTKTVDEIPESEGKFAKKHPKQGRLPPQSSGPIQR